MKIFTHILSTLTVLFILIVPIVSYGSDNFPKRVFHNSHLCANDLVDKPLIYADTLDLNLYILYIETDILTSKLLNKKRLLLNFFVDESLKLTLHGWQASAALFNDGNRFEQDREIILKRTTISVDSIGKMTYLGNVVIGNDGIGKILKEIKRNPQNTKYLIFRPKKVDNHIEYGYYFSDNIAPNILRSKSSDYLGTANPTPPRQYDGTDN